MKENPFIKREKLPVRIEIAKPQNWRELKNLRIEAITGPDAEMFGATPEKVEQTKKITDKEWQEDLLPQEDKFVLLSWKGQDAIGMGRARKREKEGDWWMYADYLKPEFRGNGFGRKMFAERLKEISARKGIEVRMGVKVINERSIRLAESFGFKKIDKGSSDKGYFMELENVKDPEVIKKIESALNAG